tara:strand:- start:2112 stop:2759 length:648 start_codon:yes stop_codon:yes gene_type:complete
VLKTPPRKGRNVIEFEIRDLIIAVQAVVIIYLVYKDWFVEWRRLRRIKKSGDYGERLVSEYLDDMEEVFEVYHGIRGEYDRQHFEIDHLLLTHQGIVLIETKNIRGTIISRRNGWCQIKRSEAGKSYEREFKSPINQVERTARIFESMIKEKGFRVKVVPMVVFSNRDVELKLPTQKYPVLQLYELESEVSEISRDVPLTTRNLRKLKKILDDNF